ncbi:TetR/AcrR family transcriptional regulator [Actinomycetospora straminea]|uniref:TetR/AcrR family transcriptional regulator n=1 Tax=Actinomycetospora straminea TaxID=663607 RepID=A0ABP9E679_9PSEU|nr:TetR/AcrR family transcriptional regulator [Actinomycetospora straminea]MDD7935954.1 TetR/AcrR family transcriptional regulator [Actinomycetospora straminea]
MTSETPRRRLAPEVRRRQVLDAAVAVFSEEGFHGASMDAVAARAGVSKPLVYAHGGSKDELFAACLRREAERLLRSVQTAAGAPGEAPLVRLRRALRAFFHALTMQRAGWTVLYRQASTGPFAGEVDALRRRIVEQAADLMAGGLGVPRAVALPYAHTVVGAAEGLADWWLTDPDAGEAARTDPDVEPADVLADMLVAVVGPGLDALTGGAIGVSATVSDER